MRFFYFSLTLLLISLLPLTSQARFPEFGFCPMGGPPGWLNRLTGEHKKRYYYPPPPRYPAVIPNTWQRPFNAYPAANSRSAVPGYR